MTSFVNRKLSQIRPSATLAVAAKAAALRAEGRSIVNLSTGEPDIDTPGHIKVACGEAMGAGFTKYAPVPGIPDLRTALAEKLTSENSIPATRDSVIVTNGGKQALFQCFQAVLEPGDEVIIPAPYWVSYPAMVQLAGGEPRIITTEPELGYRITPVQLKESLTERTKVVVLNSPSNPTGAVYSAQQLRELGEVLQDYPGVLAISDEVYEKLCFGDVPFCSFVAAAPWMADRTVTVNAFSKTYSMTGWRVGYATGPLDVIKAMSTLQSQATSGVNTMAQHAALAALKGPQDFLGPLVESYGRRAAMAAQAVRSIKGLTVPTDPQGAFYLYVRIDGLVKDGLVANSSQLATALLESVGLAVVPGEGFGDPSAFRISTAASEATLEDGLERLKNGIGELI